MTQLLTLNLNRHGEDMDVRQPLLMLIARVAGPNVLIAVNLLLVLFYWQGGIPPSSIADGHWKEIAVSALSLVGIIGGFTMRMLFKQFTELKATIKEHHEKQDKRHAQNVTALMQMLIALKTGKMDDLDPGTLIDPDLM